jgi:hypothetical protein
MSSSAILAAQLEGRGLENSSESAAPAAPTAPSTSAFPSPASQLDSPDYSVHHGLAAAPLTTYTSLAESNIAQPFPLPSTTPDPLPTPLSEHLPDLHLDFSASALPSGDLSLPTPPIVKAGHDLRLPSFDALGIANPHPDRAASYSVNPFSPLGAGPLSKPEDPLHALSPPLAHAHHFGGVTNSPASPHGPRAAIEHPTPALTPPTDFGGIFNWRFTVKARTAGIGSPPRSDPGNPLITNTIAGADSAGQPATANWSVAGLSDALEMAAWIETVKVIISENPPAANPAQC